MRMLPAAVPFVYLANDQGNHHYQQSSGAKTMIRQRHTKSFIVLVFEGA